MAEHAGGDCVDERMLEDKLTRGAPPADPCRLDPERHPDIRIRKTADATKDVAELLARFRVIRKRIKAYGDMRSLIKEGRKY